MSSIIAIDRPSHTCDKNDNAPGQGGIEGYRSNYYRSDYTSKSAPPCGRHQSLPALLRAGPAGRPSTWDPNHSAVHALLPGSHQERHVVAAKFTLEPDHTRHLNSSIRCALTTTPHAGSPQMKEVS